MSFVGYHLCIIFHGLHVLTGVYRPANFGGAGSLDALTGILRPVHFGGVGSMHLFGSLDVPIGSATDVYKPFGFITGYKTPHMQMSQMFKWFELA